MNQDISKVKSIGELVYQIIEASRNAGSGIAIGLTNAGNAGTTINFFGRDPRRAASQTERTWGCRELESWIFAHVQKLQ